MLTWSSLENANLTLMWRPVRYSGSEQRSELVGSDRAAEVIALSFFTLMSLEKVQLFFCFHALQIHVACFRMEGLPGDCMSAQARTELTVLVG
jgi:hypothetical protein